MIGNDLTLLCENCFPKCLTCDGIGFNKCTSCSTGSKFGPFLLNGECLDNCPSTYYADIKDGKCKLCDNKCLSCFNAGSEACYTCAPLFFLLKNACIPDCGDGYYGDANNICISCDPTCLDCNGSGRDKCTKCTLKRIFENGNTCRACSEFYGMEDDPNIPDTQQMVCREICGDGITVTKQYECDDGNKNDGDGCSKDCKVEPGFWKCINGDDKTPHTCYDYRSIGFTIEYKT